ncbi:tyrosine protein phosphatase yvh1 [Dimargaris xerosporica]|nr:tyrosine protein phosphatase yvh1 [Dimargaris xerosporica]
MAGISRSATIVIAYLMKTYNLALAEAMDKVRTKRSIINPNRGFYMQLERYQTIKENTSESHKATRRYHIEREAVARNGFHSSHNHVHLRIPIQTSDASHTPINATATTATAASSSGSQSQFRCKKCRTTLFNDEFILGHEPSEKKGGFHPRKARNQADTRYVIKNVSETKGPMYTDRRYVQVAVSTDNDSLHATCSSYFIEPMQWIAGSSDGSHEGRIDCFKCGTKLGAYDWSGLACSCSRWITPAFMVHKGKVDKVMAFM